MKNLKYRAIAHFNAVVDKAIYLAECREIAFRLMYEATDEDLKIASSWLEEYGNAARDARDEVFKIWVNWTPDSNIPHDLVVHGEKKSNDAFYCLRRVLKELHSA